MDPDRIALACREPSSSWSGPNSARMLLEVKHNDASAHWTVKQPDLNVAPNFYLLVETLAYSLKGEKGAPGPKGTFVQIILETDDLSLP